MLMEAALGERLKREYGLAIDGPVAMADLICHKTGKSALCKLWLEYLSIAEEYHLPFLATTPTRRANQTRVLSAGYDSALLYENVSLLKLPYIISFTITPDGRLIDNTTIDSAIRSIDQHVKRPPLCYMTNCVHPDILSRALSHDFNRTLNVQTRFLGIQANASPLTYEELDGSHDLKCSDPVSLAQSMIQAKRKFGLRILGGCCGTDGNHLREIAKSLGG